MTCSCGTARINFKMRSKRRSLSAMAIESMRLGTNAATTTARSNAFHAPASPRKNAKGRSANTNIFSASSAANTQTTASPTVFHAAGVASSAPRDVSTPVSTPATRMTHTTNASKNLLLTKRETYVWHVLNADVFVPSRARAAAASRASVSRESFPEITSSVATTFSKSSAPSAAAAASRLAKTPALALAAFAARRSSALVSRRISAACSILLVMTPMKSDIMIWPTMSMSETKYRHASAFCALGATQRSGSSSYPYRSHP